MNNTTRAFGYAGLTVFFWSTVATAFKLALQILDIYQLILYACLTSCLVLLTALWIQGEIALLGATFRQHWRITLISGLINPLAYYLVLFAAYDQLPAQVAQPINYTWAIVLTVLSVVILGQRITRRDIFATLVCYSGVVLICIQGEWRLPAASLPGIALALGSTLLWATYWIINIRDPRDSTIALTLNFLVALPAALLLCSVMSSPVDVSVTGLGAAVYIGLFEMGLAFLFWSRALKLAPNTSRVSNLIFLSPFVSLLLIHNILGETIHLTTWIGLVVIISGLLIQQLPRTR
ncbi:MAG: DMT family transporter [Pseudomonadota bacterium]